MENIALIKSVRIKGSEELEKGKFKEYMLSLELENRLVELEITREFFEETLKNNNVKTKYTKNTLIIECEGDSPIVKKKCEILIEWNELIEKYIFKLYGKNIIKGEDFNCKFFDANNDKELMDILTQFLL